MTDPAAQPPADSPHFAGGREYGITALGDFLLSEGVPAVVEHLVAAGVTAVACNPTVTAPSNAGAGTFQPPADAGASPRVFDRPLFGQPALWVRSGPSYFPDESLYSDLTYAPRRPNDLTERHGAIIGEFIDACHARGLTVYFQLGAVQPTRLRDQDRPRLPNGELPPGRLADTGSLASYDIRDYNRTYLKDLLQHYPQIDGIRIDWPEAPCYTWGEVFQDFSPHVERFARKYGYDFDSIRHDVGQLYDYSLRGLTNDDLQAFGASPQNLTLFGWANVAHAAVLEWLRLKAHLSRDTIHAWGEALNDAGAGNKRLVAHAFMPPYSFLTGFDFSGAAELADCIAPKFYTMHWSLMVEFWAKALMEHNTLDERLVVKCLQDWMQLDHPDSDTPLVSDFGYPGPDEPHPVTESCQRTRITQTLAMTRGANRSASLVPLVHGYGPLADFQRRLELVANSGTDGFWINRYGYLSDEKLAAVRQVIDNCRQDAGASDES